MFTAWLQQLQGTPWLLSVCSGHFRLPTVPRHLLYFPTIPCTTSTPHISVLKTLPNVLTVSLSQKPFPGAFSLPPPPLPPPPTPETNPFLKGTEVVEGEEVFVKPL